MRCLGALFGAALGLVFGLGAAAQADGTCTKADNVTHVRSPGHCLGIQTHDKAGGTPRAVIVYLHGDISRGGDADYMGKYAGNTPAGTVGVAMLRPGYGGFGRKSTGSTNGRRDHYTAVNVDAVAGALKSLKGHYGGARLVVVGHSGGAATLATILGRHPGVVDTAVLVSCPCDLVTWRASRGRSMWNNSLNPDKFVSKVPAQTRVFLITGSSDSNTRPSLAQAYYGKLKQRGVAANIQIVSGGRHGFSSLASAVEAVVRAEVDG